VKKFLKVIAALAIFAAVAGVAWQHYSAWQSSRDEREAAQAPQGKLPTGVTPLHYTLSLRIDPDQRRFSGTVRIAVDIQQQQSEIWIHGKDIRAHDVELEHSDGTITTLDYKEMGHSGIVRLSTKRPIPAQRATINISFDAPFNKKLEGLFKVQDQGLNYAFTQFEAVQARQVFPQFDEPRFKVPYDISIEVQQRHSGFGNTPVIREELLEDGFKRLTFATTPPLPSYLLAFAVGELDVVEYEDIPATAVRERPIPLKGVATKGKGQKLGYALKHTAALLTTLEEYFGIPYPYAKLDIVAVPDFASGAMENAGLITYRETLLLFDEHPSVSQQRRFANVHAHELAHQWFGNLVTMPWWDDIWLNESFATWMASKTVQQWNPGFEVDREIIRGGHWVMGSDIYTDSRRIREPVESNDDIANAFDGISYSKGSAVLQMLESTITPEVFRKGIQHYLQQYAWGNATAQNLMDALADAAGNQQVARFADSFLNQPGVPLFKLDWHCDEGKLELNFQQQRYLPVGSTLSPDQKWITPVCLTLIENDQSRRLCHTVSEYRQSFTDSVAQCPSAIMPNNNGSGYYRWTLDESRWRGLLNHIGSLNAAEKYSVANNLAAEYAAARIDTGFYLQAITPVIAQSEWDVRTEPTWQIQKISDDIANAEQQALLAAYLDQQFKPLLDELGLEPNTSADAANPVSTQLLRERVLRLVALALQQPELLAQLAERGKALIGYGVDTGFNGDAIDPQLQAVAMASAVISLGTPYFEALMSMTFSSRDANFRRNAIWAVGQTTDPELSGRILDLRQMLKLKLNEIPVLIQSHMSKAENRQRTFDWIKKYYSVISLVIPTQYLADTPSLAGDLCSREAYNDAQAFFSPEVAKVRGMQRNLSQNLEKIQLCYSLTEAQRTRSWTIN
jgi:alanyl aminopeptidase